jgi:hypothetical protein
MNLRKSVSETSELSDSSSRGTVTKKPKLSIETVKMMVADDGMTLRDIAQASGYSVSEIAAFCIVWKVKRKRGPKVGWKRVQQ